MECSVLSINCDPSLFSHLRDAASDTFRNRADAVYSV